MAKQHGVIKIQGTIGDITFFRNSDGSYGAKAKGGVSKEKIATDPAYARTRENGQEFGQAGKSGKVLRSAFQTLLAGADRKMLGRLLKQMMFCIKADTTSIRGRRNVASGDPLLMNGFEFNENGKLGTTLLVPFTTTVTRSSGAADVVLPAYVPTTSIMAPQGATHYKIVAAAAEIDYVNEKYVADITSTAFLPVNNTATSPLTLSATLSTASTLPIYQVVSIQFYQEVNGVKYPLNNGSFDPVKIVNADV